MYNTHGIKDFKEFAHDLKNLRRSQNLQKNQGISKDCKDFQGFYARFHGRRNQISRIVNSKIRFN